LLALAVAAASAAGVRAAAEAGPRVSEATPSTAVKWLTKAVRAPVRVSYRATETLRIQSKTGDRAQRVRVVHRVPDDTRREYLSPRGDVELIIADDGHSHWQYSPGRQEIIFSNSVRVDRELWQQRHLERLLGNYTVSEAGQATVGGRTARVLVMTPRAGRYGPSKRLVVDEATGLILQSELATSDGATKLDSTLSDLRFEKTIPSSEFTPPAKPAKQRVIYEQIVVLPLDALVHQWKHPLMIPKRMARGYRLESARLLRRGRHTFMHLRYFDGLNALSLFESRSSSGGSRDPRLSEVRVHGAPAAWRFLPPFWSLSWRERGLRLTLVGDLPRKELLRIAQRSGWVSR
jgi:outer membrane lipoprotein-sorting protein